MSAASGTGIGSAMPIGMLGCIASYLPPVDVRS